MPRLFHPLFLLPVLFAAPVVCPSFTSAVHAQAWVEEKVGPVVPLTAEEWARLRARYEVEPEVQTSAKPILAQADAALSAEPQPPARIAFEGRRARDKDRIDTENRLLDMEKLRVLTFAYAATGEARYGNKAKAFVTEWANTVQPSGNAINDNKLEAVFLAAPVLKPLFSAEETEKLNRWLRRIADSGAPRAGNAFWETRRAKNLALIGLALENQKLLASAVELTKLAVGRDLRPGGGSADLELHDALSFHVLGVRPLVELALALRGVEPGLYTYVAPNGASIKTSVDFVKPYARGEKVYPQWTNTKYQLDKNWWRAGDANYEPGSPWRPREGTTLLELAGFLDAEAAELAPRNRYAVGVVWMDVLGQVVRGK